MLDTDLDVRGNVGVRGVKVSVPMTSKSASLAPSPSSAAASAGSTQVPWIPQHHASSSMQEDLDSNIAGGAGPPTAGLSSDHRSFTLDLNEFDDLAYNMPSWLPPYDDFVDHMASGSSSLTPSSTIAADAMITDGYGHDPLNDQQFDLFDFLPSTQAAPLSFPNESAGNLGLAGDHPSLDTSRLQQQTKLYGVFLDQVDTVVKILHVPSLTLFMKHNEPYLAYPRGHPAPAALRSAVLYSAACTMSEDRVHALFDTSKSEFVNKMREECEETLHRAGILHQQDVTCLQALVLYLVSLSPGAPVLFFIESLT
ncbi:hypothetical protein PRZ48_005355 [Zasmidium cellare]|uniref:Transcription factor domain-containing protein n=1 Tax=Zasmidium cellare TaxID=395010 RepID=A0ABR0ES44_ZASCE|nr:hypothetical protein PRZ48_005355 [Zasmidium cellare]